MHCSVRVLALTSTGLLALGLIAFSVLAPWACFPRCTENLPVLAFEGGAILLGPGIIGALVAFIIYERSLLSHNLLRQMYISSSIVLAFVLLAIGVLWRTLDGALLPRTWDEVNKWSTLLEAYSLCVVFGLVLLSTTRPPCPRTE